MATLNNQKIKDTFKGLLKTLDNAEITGQVEITDGDGNQTGVFINTDGSIKVTGTAEFGSLKDTGEDITITKFVDEADGISNNDDDSSIPTSAAVKDYVDTNVTAQDLDFQGDGGTGAVDLDSQSLDIAGGTGITTTALDQTLTIDIDSTVATLSDTQTLTNKSIDLTDNTITGTTSQFNTALSDDNFATLAGTETLTNKTINADNNTVSNIETDNLKAGVLDTDLNSVSASDDTLASAKAIKTYVDTQITAEDLDFSGNTGSGSVDLDSQTFFVTGTGIATTEAANQGLEVNVPATNLSNTPAPTTLEVEISTGNNTTLPAATTTNAGVMTGADKTKLDGIETGAEVNVVTSVNTETGAVVLDTDDISEGTSNLYYTDARVSTNSSVAANTAKVGITTQQASNITTNNAKVGITTQQASNITANNAKVGITTEQANAITANTAKNSYPTADATKLAGIEAGAEVNPTSTDELSEGSSNLYYTEARVSANTSVVANTAKVGITTQQANNITANNAKISFDSASSTKLAGIETGADVTDTANVTAAGALMDSEVDADIKTLSLPANTTISSFAQSFLDDADAATVRATIGAGTSSTTGTVTIVTVGIGLDVTNGTTAPSISLDLSEFTDMTADMVETDEFIVLDNGAERRKAVNEIKSTLFSNNDLYKVIGIATDHASRVTLDNGTSEGATSIMQNFEILIAN